MTMFNDAPQDPQAPEEQAPSMPPAGDEATPAGM